MQRFWTVSQNNSGGEFHANPKHGIGYALCVEATDEQHAARRMQQITADAGYDQSDDCPCCGDRWSFDYFMDAGTETPELYGKPLCGKWRLPSYVHYLDGRIESRPATADR
jgi:hypothetical protein